MVRDVVGFLIRLGLLAFVLGLALGLYMGFKAGAAMHEPAVGIILLRLGV